MSEVKNPVTAIISGDVFPGRSVMCWLLPDLR